MLHFRFEAAPPYSFADFSLVGRDRYLAWDTTIVAGTPPFPNPPPLMYERFLTLYSEAQDRYTKINLGNRSASELTLVVRGDVQYIYFLSATLDDASASQRLDVYEWRSDTEELRRVSDGINHAEALATDGQRIAWRSRPASSGSSVFDVLATTIDSLGPIQTIATSASWMGAGDGAILWHGPRDGSISNEWRMSSNNVDGRKHSQHLDPRLHVISAGEDGVVILQSSGRDPAASSLKCDTAQPVRCRPNGNPLLAHNAG